MKEFDKVIGYDAIKKELEIICDTMRNTEKYEKLGVNIPKGVLLYGSPGVGKTLLANCILKASGRNVFVCRKNGSNEQFSSKIEEVFKEAQDNAPSIILFDDMDKFSNNDTFHKNSDVFVSIQSFIDGCKNGEVFVLATCNDIRSMPESLLRAGRFDKVIEIQNPTGEDAVNIVKHYLCQKKQVGDIDAEEIAKILDGRTCAELEMVVNEAGIYAGFNNKESIDMDDIIRACMRVIFDAPESMSITDGKVLEATAYHEAGHTVIAEILDPGSVNLVSVRKTTGDVAGITSSKLADTYWINKSLMENRVICLLGGRAATEIKYGNVDVGTHSDLRRAFSIVERFVDNYCSYGFDKYMSSPRDASNDLRRVNEIQVSHDMERFYAQAKKIIVDNIEFLHKLAQELILKETLRQKDIKAIRESCNL